MPTSPAWVSRAVSAVRGAKEGKQLLMPPLQPAKTPAPDTLLQCECHPTLDVPSSKLCDACQIFVRRCHWIQCFKLPSSQFSKLSNRKLKRGSEFWDGEVPRVMHWDFNYQRKLTKACPLCELIGTAWEDRRDDTGYANVTKTLSIKFTVNFNNQDESDEASLDVTIENDDSEPMSARFRLYHEWKIGHSETGNTILPARTKVAAKDIPPRLGPCTASNANARLARSWLKTCINDHLSCGQKVAEAKHPLRLIAVGCGTDNPHLHEVEPGEQIPEYMTLSHCWGGKTPLTLTLDSLDALKECIKFQLLSTTFQEAILTVRRLNYEYLWIDSLCIIQDSADDWKMVSQFMGDIYRNSICTIAATASKNGDGGLFRTRNTQRNERCEIWSDAEHGIYLEIQKGVPLQRYRREVNGGPLNTRAWVLQERYLSPRVLHFSSSTVYWDCEETHTCDYGMGTEDNSTLSPGFGDGSIRPFQIDYHRSDFSTDFLDRWKDAIEIYSRMCLTRESDRLIAFQGVTALFEERSGLKSSYGVWKQFIPEQLLWRIHGANRRVTPAKNAIPSWSWASVEIPIDFFPPNVGAQAITFWYPSSDPGWPDRGPLDPNDPDCINLVVADLMRTGVDPQNGYSSDRVICATYLESLDSGQSLYILGKINKATSGTVMTVDGRFTPEQEDKILSTLQLKKDHSDVYQALLICQLPDTLSVPLAHVHYLRIQAEGAHRPSTDRFLEKYMGNNDGELLAPYALHTSGLMLMASEVPDVYTRVGYFRAIETFGHAPHPHPKGVNLEDEILQHCWFGEECQERTIEIV